MSSPVPGGEWKKTACILCECNCGIDVQLGGEGGRHIVRLRGDKDHPSSKGYTCEKPTRLDHYQNARRLTAPLRRRADGSFEEIDWDTAIREVAEKLMAIRDTHGGDKIFYYGGGGQGNHLPGGYARATLSLLGSVYRSNALAQEKTGEAWVQGRMMGAFQRADFENAEVALFVGKNPWQSHGFPQARITLKSIARDPERTLIVIDPRETETAKLADIHLRVKPGGDAWLLSAMAGILVQEDRIDHAWLAEHADGVEEVLAALVEIPVAEYCAKAGVPEALVHQAVERIAAASSVAVAEDLGIQQGVNSTLCSYLERFLWMLTGNFAKPGTAYCPSSITRLLSSSDDAPGAKKKRSRQSPVAGARIISGLVPCNVIAEEILTDHPDRYRAMIVEATNPAHSLADSQRMREAFRALECLVVIDIALTETARLADYVLPTSTQYEKYEATFFNFEFPENYFHLRKPILEPPEGVLCEPEIHARLCEAMGALTNDDLAPLHAAASKGRQAFAEAFLKAMSESPRLGRLAPVVLYRTLGPTLEREDLPEGAASAAAIWGLVQTAALANADSIRRAGFEGEGLELGENLFNAILESPSGVVFTVDDYAKSWERVATPGGKIQLVIPELLAELAELPGRELPGGSPEFPFVLSAGERRSFTANTILRDPAWRKKDPQGALRISPADAEHLGLHPGGRALITTKRASAEVAIEISEMMQPGHISLPNGLGTDHRSADGTVETEITGVPPNELTASEDRDPIAGTPWHKHVPARVEAILP